MNIYGTQYTLNRRAYEIYVAGCAASPHCKDCHTPWTWDFQAGTPYKEKLPSILSDIERFRKMIDCIMIFGGEPLDQPIDELKNMLAILSENFQLPIWLFTRYELEEALAKFPFLPYYVSYLKTGPYIPSLATDTNIQYGIQLATSNQRIHQLQGGTNNHGAKES